MALDPILWALKDAPVVDPYERVILIAYAETADEDGCAAFPSYATLAKLAGCDRQTAKDRVKALARRGLLRRGDQAAAAYLRADVRPVVYDVMIPYSWWSRAARERVDQFRAQRGRPPLTAQSRPDLAPAPARKRRADAGKSRRATARSQSTGGVVDPPVDNPPDTPTRDVADPPRGVSEIPDQGMPETPEPPLGTSPGTSYLSGDDSAGSAAVVEHVQEEAETGPEPPETTPPPADAGELEPAGAAELVASVPWPWRLDAGTRRTLRGLAARCLRAGHPPAVVAAEAAAGIPGATGPGAAVTRLRALAETPPDGADVAASQAAAERAERERMARTPHPFEAGRSAGYCTCGRYQTNQVHTSSAPAGRPAEESTDAGGCRHGRRVCVDCAAPASTTTAGRTPAPRRPAEPERAGLAALDQALAELRAAASSSATTTTSGHRVSVPA